MVAVRPFSAADHDAVVRLADRLSVGVAPWRSPERVLVAVRGWVSRAVDAVNSGSADRAVFVAVEEGEILGFVSVTEDAHWSGELDAYIGELVVDRRHEKRGVGTDLVTTAEDWAAARGLRRIRLSTGAANTAALGLYDALGYLAEDVSLSKGIAPRSAVERSVRG